MRRKSKRDWSRVVPSSHERATPKLDAAALAFLSKALEAGPKAYGLRVTIWTIRDLRDELAHRLAVRVCTATVHRQLQRLGLGRPPPS